VYKATFPLKNRYCLEQSAVCYVIAECPKTVDLPQRSDLVTGTRAAEQGSK